MRLLELHLFHRRENYINAALKFFKNIYFSIMNLKFAESFKSDVKLMEDIIKYIHAIVSAGLRVHVLKFYRICFRGKTCFSGQTIKLENFPAKHVVFKGCVEKYNLIFFQKHRFYFFFDKLFESASYYVTRVNIHIYIVGI